MSINILSLWLIRYMTFSTQRKWRITEEAKEDQINIITIEAIALKSMMML